MKQDGLKFKLNWNLVSGPIYRLDFVRYGHNV